MKHTATRFYVVFFVIFCAADVQAKVWTLENTPKQHRPALCAKLLDVLSYDLGTASYQRALKRKAEGNMWRVHKERIDDIENLRSIMRKLQCGRIP
jgi:predicted secreted protein